jgi:hypothetical protein
MGVLVLCLSVVQKEYALQFVGILRSVPFEVHKDQQQT